MSPANAQPSDAPEAQFPAPLQGVIFDLDGTIVDTEEVVYRSIAEEFHRHGLEFPLPVWVHEAVGHAHYFDWPEYLQTQLGSPINRAEVEARVAARESELIDTVQARPGVIALVESLSNCGVPMAVASNSPGYWVKENLDRLGLTDRFAGYFGRDMVAEPKPAPDSYLAAAALIGADPRRCVGIEDSTVGLAAVMAAGMASVACPSVITEGLDFAGASLQVSQLSAVTVQTLVDLAARN